MSHLREGDVGMKLWSLLQPERVLLRESWAAPAEPAALC